MCGIAGVISSKPLDREVIFKMTDRLSHRGPDAGGIYQHPDNKVALGHRRLSIIDLREIANQPFASKDGRYNAVFNGEIYNFKSIKKRLVEEHGVEFRSDSDTEVIVYAFAVWGCKMVTSLEGMFAIVIFDIQDNKCYVFRDRVGKKPLYYYFNNGTFVFASELKSLLANDEVKTGTSIRKETVSVFLQLGYIPSPHTIYNHIKKFPSGHYAVLDNRSFQFDTYPYWQIADFFQEKKIETAMALPKLKAILDKSVSERLVSDVPVGAFLSGGIDSSLVTSLMVKHSKEKVKTFTIGFSEKHFDERSYAKSIADYLKTDHHEFVVSYRQAAELMETYLDHFDEPFADTSAIPTMLVSALAKKHVSVVLTGDGGDELFLGYGSYMWADRLLNPLVKAFGTSIANILKHWPVQRYKRAARLFEQVSDQKRRQHIFSQEQYFFSEQEIRNNLLREFVPFLDWQYTDSESSKSVLEESEKQAAFDLQYYLQDDLLVKVDRASMFYGLECRSPLLDHELIEFAFNLPAELKKNSKESKVLLRQVLHEYLPKEMFDRPKKGFSIPLQDWLKNDLNYLMEYLSKANLEATGLFLPTYVANLKARFLKGESYLYHRLWALIVVQRFLLKNIAPKF